MQIFKINLDLEPSDFLFSNDFEVINKGSIAEQFVGLKFIKKLVAIHI